jgi:hypothetical protein
LAFGWVGEVSTVPVGCRGVEAAGWMGMGQRGQGWPLDGCEAKSPTDLRHEKFMRRRGRVGLGRPVGYQIMNWHRGGGRGMALAVGGRAMTMWVKARRGFRSKWKSRFNVRNLGSSGDRMMGAHAPGPDEVCSQSQRQD